MRSGRFAAVLVAALAQACGRGDGAISDAGHEVDAARLDAALMDAGPNGSNSSDGGSDASDAGAIDRLDEVLATLRGEADPAALDALLEDVARREGWPLTSGTRWLFATRWEALGVSWVGDPNLWDPTVTPAETSPSGLHHFVVVELPAALRGAKYKWWSAGAFRAPSESTAYGEDEFGEHGYIAPPADRAWFERFPGFRAVGLEPRGIRLRIPPDFSWSVTGTRAGRATRTLLFHDGQNVFLSGGTFGTWRVDDALRGAFDDVLAVGVESAADRFESYTPVPDDLGDGAVGGRADAYLSLLESEVVPFVRARYGVRASGVSLAVVGSSLGGLVSLHHALVRPSFAGCFAGLSSTLGWGAFGADGSGALVRRWSEHGRATLYLDSGGGLIAGACEDRDGDGVFEDSSDRDNYCVTAQLRDRLLALGYQAGRDLFYHHEPGAPHAEAAWAARVERVLEACSAGGWVAD